MEAFDYKTSNLHLYLKISAKYLRGKDQDMEYFNSKLGPDLDGAVTKDETKHYKPT